MKKSFLSLLIAVGLIGSISAQTTTDSNNAEVTAGKLDVSEVTKAYYNFIKDLDNIQNSPPSVNSPDNTVTLINAWTTAFTNLGKVIQDFPKKHPEVLTQPT